jgi:hypothetical protein
LTSTTETPEGYGTAAYTPYGLRDQKRVKQLDRDIAQANEDSEPGSPEHNGDLMYVFAKHLYQLVASGGSWHDVEHLLRSMIGCLINSRTGFGMLMLPHPGSVSEELEDDVYKYICMVADRLEQADVQSPSIEPDQEAA